MADLLGSLKQEGKVDSSGIFTMDLRKAIEKLARFQLPQHYYYIPKMVQAAVAGGASYVVVKINESRVLIEFDGRPYSAEELANIFQYMLASRHLEEHRHLRHLATAINTAIALEARTVQVDSGPGREVVRQRWHAHDRSENYKLDQPWPDHEVRTRFSLFRSLSDMRDKWWHTAGKADIWDLLTKNPRAMTPEQSELVHRVVWCPIPVFLNGRQLNRERFGVPVLGVGLDRILSSNDFFAGKVHKKHHLVERIVTLENGGPRQINIPEESTASRYERLQLSREEAPCEAMLALQMGKNSEGQKNATLHFVQDGILVGKVQTPLNAPGAVGVLEARGLTFDLSQFVLNTKDEAFSDRLYWLRKNFDELRTLLQERAELGVGDIPANILRTRMTW